MITKKAAKGIARLINDMECADLMRVSMADDGNWERVEYYRTKWAVAIMKLHTDYGIELPNLDTARDLILGEVA
jgi:hypothetical protein